MYNNLEDLQSIKEFVVSHITCVGQHNKGAGQEEKPEQCVGIGRQCTMQLGKDVAGCGVRQSVEKED